MKEARSLLEQNVKHEKETDACVSKWRRQNAKWLRKRKRVEKTEAPIVEERGRVQNTDISRAKMMEKLSESFKPTILLSDDDNLKAKNEFKAAMDKYYKYNRETIAQLPEGMFYDIFLTFCNPDMRNKLSNIKNVEKMKPEEIWAQVELMFLNSNPMHTRGIQALDTKMVKGESVSDKI